MFATIFTWALAHWGIALSGGLTILGLFGALLPKIVQNPAVQYMVGWIWGLGGFLGLALGKWLEVGNIPKVGGTVSWLKYLGIPICFALDLVIGFFSRMRDKFISAESPEMAAINTAMAAALDKVGSVDEQMYRRSKI